MSIILSSCSTVIPIDDMKTVNSKGEMEALFPTGNYQECIISRNRMEQIKNYIISIDDNGHYEPLTLKSESDSCGKVSQPNIDAKNPNQTAISLHTNNILNALFSPEQRESKTNILIFIHGGLNTSVESRSRAIEESYLISKYKGNGGRKYFPIFINWHSGGFDTYTNQIFHVRQGKEASDIRGFTTAPLYFISDAVQALGRAPATLEKNIARLIKTKLLNDSIECTPSDQLEKILCEKHKRTFFELLPRMILFIPNLPFQLLEALPADSFGKSAWVNMLRRTKMGLRTSQELEDEKAQPISFEDINQFNGQGDLAFFSDHCNKKSKKAINNIQLAPIK